MIVESVSGVKNNAESRSWIAEAITKEFHRYATQRGLDFFSNVEMKINSDESDHTIVNVTFEPTTLLGCDMMEEMYPEFRDTIDLFRKRFTASQSK
jgi:hypothetical protein